MDFVLGIDLGGTNVAAGLVDKEGKLLGEASIPTPQGAGAVADAIVQAAQKVAEKMADVARRKQVLCVTHLPQIAAMADTHFVIEKQVADNRSITRIRELEERESVEELARMLGGDAITENALKNAEEMKELAGKTK